MCLFLILTKDHKTFLLFRIMQNNIILSILIYCKCVWIIKEPVRLEQNRELINDKNGVSISWDQCFETNRSVQNLIRPTVEPICTDYNTGQNPNRPGLRMKVLTRFLVCFFHYIRTNPDGSKPGTRPDHNRTKPGPDRA